MRLQETRIRFPRRPSELPPKNRAERKRGPVDSLLCERVAKKRPRTSNQGRQTRSGRDPRLMREPYDVLARDHQSGRWHAYSTVKSAIDAVRPSTLFSQPSVTIAAVLADGRRAYLLDWKGLVSRDIVLPKDGSRLDELAEVAVPNGDL